MYFISCSYSSLSYHRHHTSLSFSCAHDRAPLPHPPGATMAPPCMPVSSYVPHPLTSLFHIPISHYSLIRSRRSCLISESRGTTLCSHDSFNVTSNNSSLISATINRFQKYACIDRCSMHLYCLVIPSSESSIEYSCYIFVAQLSVVF